MEPLTAYIVTERLGIVFLLSLIFGIERQSRKKPVGFGTFVFVSIGAALLSIIAVSFSDTTSPLPLLSGIITGIGFLGAGALIRGPEKVFGFTTAAAIWGIAAFGMTVGTGHIAYGLIFYVFFWMVLLLDVYFERIKFGHHAARISITFSNPKSIKEALSELESPVIIKASFDKEKKEHKIYLSYSGSIKNFEDIVAKVINKDNVKKIEVE
ncbi:MgtC family protein [uncultured archaeon]|nr:MgtC family protein [uncultured archaeon]